MKTVTLIEIVTPGMIEKARYKNKNLSIEDAEAKMKLFFERYPSEDFLEDICERLPINIDLLEKRWFEFLECK